VLRQAAAAPAVNGGVDGGSGDGLWLAPASWWWPWGSRRPRWDCASPGGRVDAVVVWPRRRRGGCLTSACEVEHHGGACLALRAGGGRRVAGSGGARSSAATAGRAIGGWPPVTADGGGGGRQDVARARGRQQSDETATAGWVMLR
jgi:hypothetical protein